MESQSAIERPSLKPSWSLTRVTTVGSLSLMGAEDPTSPKPTSLAADELPHLSTT